MIEFFFDKKEDNLFPNFRKIILNKCLQPGKIVFEKYCVLYLKKTGFLKKYSPFLRIFLHDHSGNPNKTNGKKETSLICVCMEKPENAQFYPVQRKRLDCLMILLKWRGSETEGGDKEKVDLGSQDEV